MSMLVPSNNWTLRSRRMASLTSPLWAKATSALARIPSRSRPRAAGIPRRGLRGSGDGLQTLILFLYIGVLLGQPLCQQLLFFGREGAFGQQVWPPSPGANQLLLQTPTGDGSVVA